VLAQLEEDLLHLERGQHRLDQDSCPDAARRDTQVLLGEGEHVVPQPRLEVALGLRQVEVRPATAGEQFTGVVEEVQSEVDQRCSRRSVIHEHPRLVEVPTPRARHDHCQTPVAPQPVLPPVWLVMRQPPAHRIGQDDLARDDVAPVRGVGVLEVGEPDSRPRVEGVHSHLRLGRAGDLHPAVHQVGGCPLHGPLPLADVASFDQEVGHAPARDLVAPDPTAPEQLITSIPEPPLQLGHEGKRIGGQDLIAARNCAARNCRAPQPDSRDKVAGHI
jgi:hypothetical protein